MRALRLRSSVGFGFVVAALSGPVFAQGAPSEPGRGPVPPPAAAPTTKAAPPVRAPAAPSAAAPIAAPSAPTAPSAKPVASSPAPSAPAPQTPAPGALVAVNAPDIVRLKNGGILRGTISELVPGEYVTLVLITGETRKLPYADVQYAGAVNAQSGAAQGAVSSPGEVPVAAGSAVPSAPTSDKSGDTQPFAVLHAQESVVNVVSMKEGITLFRRSASAGFSGVGTVSGYDEVCTTPCNVSMPAGTHTFAVSKPGGKPREADPVLLPAGKATMTVGVIDRTAVRVGVGLLGAVGLIAGFAMVLSDSSDSSGGGSIAGPAVLAGLGAGAFALAFAIPDGATVAVRADPRASNGPANRATAWLDIRDREGTPLRDRLTGITLRARF